MATEDRVIILGGEENEAEVAAPDRRRSPLLFLLPVVGLFVALIAFVATPQDEAPTTVDPSDLSAPAEPITATTAPATEPTPANVATAESVGWQTLVPVGDAWTIPAVAHGPDGWLAVSMSSSVIAHTSTDGVTWSASTITGLQGFNVRGAVGDGRMAVAVSPWDEDLDSGGVAVSDDGGVTWSVERFAEPALVRDVAVLDRGVLVVGETGTGEFQYNAAGTAAAWMLDDSGLRRLAVESSDLSQISAIVESPGGDVVLFGGDDGPAAWRESRDGTWFPTPLPTPERAGAGAFRSVIGVDGGFMALIATRAGESGRDLWRSEDLLTWAPLAEASANLISITPDGDGGAVGVADGGASIWTMDASGDEMVIAQFMGLERRIPVGLVVDVAVGPGMAVAAVESDGGPALMIQTPAEPESVVARSLEPHWERVATVDVPGATRFGWPFKSIRSGEATFLAIPGRVIELSDLDSEAPGMSPSMLSPAYAGSGPLGAWVSSDPGMTSSLYVYGSDGVWSSERVPVQQVEALGVVGDTPVAFGWGLNDYVRLERTPAGEWIESAEQPDTRVFGAVATDGGFVAVSESGMTVGSVDGLTWEPLQGELNSAWAGGVPFLTDQDDPTRIQVLDRWPEIDTLVVPESLGYLYSVHRNGADFWVHGTDRLLVGTTDAWAEYPLTLEHGAGGVVVPVPGDRPTLAVMGFGEVALLQVRP